MTGDNNARISDEHVNSIIKYLEEFFGCFRIYAVDLNGNCLFISTENSEMEDRTLSDFEGDIIENIHTMEEDDTYEDG
jgi:hypothetical protein